jgi:phage gp29-like protein
MATTKKLLIDLKLNADNLTKKDIGTWRRAWQAAINPESPLRTPLYDVYTDVDADLHITGAISQRTKIVTSKSFKIVGKDGKEKPEVTELFEVEWFKKFMKHALDSIYWGHSLIQFNEIINDGVRMRYSSVELVPRKHVVPEYGVITREPGEDWKRGISYLDGNIANSCIAVGDPKDLGLFLKLAPAALSKKNMLAYWDSFGEIFGMPIRIGKTASRDPKDVQRTEKFLQDMGAAGWGLFPEGTEIEFKETSQGDAFNVYDKRILRSNSELSKAILNQTMTIDDGSSRSQSETHLELFKNLTDADADMVRDVINWKLIPFMLKNGFPVGDCRFDWDESVDWTPEQQIQIEKMLLDYYDVDPKYFIDKYNVTILGVKKSNTLKDVDRFFV